MSTLYLWPTRYRKPAIGLLTGCTAAFVGCTSTAPTPGDVLAIADDPIIVLREIRSFPFTLDDELEISSVADLVSMPNGYAVADGAGFVHLLNEDLSPRARFGGEGSGPHELRFPQDLESLGTAVAVHDSGNNRITLIDEFGDLANTFPPRAAPAGDFAWQPDGSIVVRRGSGQSGLAYYHPSPKGNFGQGTVPPLRDPEGNAEISDLSSGYLTADPTGRVHYYDTARDLFITYGPKGAVETTLRLPDAVREEMLDARKDAEEAFKGRFVGFSFVMSLTTWDKYPVIVAPGLPGIEALALVVEPDRKVLTPVVVGPSLSGSTLPSPKALAFNGNVLTIGTRSGLYQYEVRYPAHLQPG